MTGPAQARRLRRMRAPSLSRLREIHEHDVRRVADRHVVAGELQPAGLRVHAEHGDVVGPLVAAVEELARRVEGEAARIVAARPLVARRRSARRSAPTAKIADAVVQPVAGVDEPAVGRDEDLRAEVAAGEAGRQGRDGLPRRQAPARGVVVEAARSSSLPPGSSRASGRSGWKWKCRGPSPGGSETSWWIAGREHAASRRRTSRRRSDRAPGRRAARSAPTDRPGSCARACGRGR